MSRVVECLKSIGYRELTSLQKRVFKEIVSTNKSVIIVAPTGSGKTEAAMFPLMYLIRRDKSKPISIIYITPLRALNRDIEDRIKKMAKCFDLTVSLRHGDTPRSMRKAIEENPPHILVTTPESLNYIVIHDRLRDHLSNLKYIVIDEFRELLMSKRGLLLFTTIYLLEKIIGKRFRKIALTATLKNEDIARRILEGSLYPLNTVVVRDDSRKSFEIRVVEPSRLSSLKPVSSGSIDPSVGRRISYLLKVLSENKGVLIFTNTRSLAEKLGFILNSEVEEEGLSFKIGVHHGSLSRSHRVSVEKGFKRGEYRGLIATSSMELGIDIGFVDYVVQYMSPRQAVRLLQRIGRSGHKLGSVSRGDVIVYDNVYQILESIVLTRRARDYDLEEERIHESPLDVLAYAISIYLLMNPRGVNVYELYNYLINHPLYQNLDFKHYTELLDYLEYVRVARIRDDKIYPTRKTRLYIYKTTMIPNTRDVAVVDVASNKQVGVLNEEYVVLNVNEGDTIVLGGRLWRVVGYDGESSKLYVEPYIAEVDELIIPHWEGENIPVEYKVAREVGSIVRRLKNHEFPRGYDEFRELIEDVRSRVAGLGDDREIVIDYCEELNLVTINIYGGTRINRLIKDLLRSILPKLYPFIKFEVYSNPYVVLVKFDQPVNYYVENILDRIEHIIRNVDKYIEPEVLEKLISSQNTLLWRIYQVAQRFGAIDPSKTRVTRSILEGFKESIIGVEGFREVLFKDYDIESAGKLAEMIREGRVRIVKRKNSRPGSLHREVLNYVETPSLSTVKPFNPVEYRERIMKRKISMLCIRCGYLFRGSVEEIVRSRKYTCPRCGSNALAPLKSDGVVEREIVLKNLRGARLRKDEEKVLEDLRKRAILFIQFGETALIALSSRGVGVSEAVRVLNKVSSGSDLYRELYESEKKFVKIKKYIDRDKER